MGGLSTNCGFLQKKQKTKQYNKAIGFLFQYGNKATVLVPYNMGLRGTEDKIKESKRYYLALLWQE
jgi:hypothetical protein